MERISFEQFKRADIRIGTIISAERIEGADKLLKLMVDLGEQEPRQLLAGIAQFIEDPSSLKGKQIPVVANLEPRTMRGLESNGMMLAAHQEGSNPVFLSPEEQVPPGSNVS